MREKILLFVTCFLIFNCYCQDLIISGVFHGNVANNGSTGGNGNNPRVVEFYVLNDIPDMSIYGLSSISGGGLQTSPEFQFPVGAKTAGTRLYVTAISGKFIDFFGFPPDYEDGGSIGGVTGDDAVQLLITSNGGSTWTTEDLFGDPDVDGTGTAWDYEYGWASRTAGGPDGANFIISNWTFSGVDENRDDATYDTATNPWGFGLYLPPLVEVLEDSNSMGGANNANGNPITNNQLASIGINSLDITKEADYQTAINTETGFSNPPTVAEVQAIIDSVNNGGGGDAAILAEVLEDSNATGGANNANATPVTVAQLAALTGIMNVDNTLESQYQAAINAETTFSDPTTLAEVQTVIDTVNATAAADAAILAEVLEDSNATGGANNANATPVTVAQLAALTGIMNVDNTLESQYQAAINAETTFSDPTTLAEVQAVIDEVNAVANVVSAALINTLTEQKLTDAGITQTGLTAQQINSITAELNSINPAPVNTEELQNLVDGVLITLGSLSNYSGKHFVVYPNPTDGEINIPIEIVKVTVFNTLSQKLIESRNTTINISPLNSGIYILEIKTKFGVAYRRIFKN